MRDTYKRLLPLTVVATAILGLGGAGRLAGQWPQIPQRYPEPDENAARRLSDSPFRPFADRDYGFAGLRLAGNYDACTENWWITWQCWKVNHPEPGPTPARGSRPNWFGIFLYVAAPAGERDRHMDRVPSLANALGRGYTLNTVLTYYAGEMLPHDGTLGPYQSGVQNTRDGSCQQFETGEPGWPLLAVNDCPQTWGSLGWQGSRVVDAEGFLAYAGQVGDGNLAFDPWKVPVDYQRTDKYLGDVQAHGFLSDYSVETLFGSLAYASYGNVIPAGMGGDPEEAPGRSGWPLGLLFEMDAFSFALPGMQNTGWWQYTITNNSAEVYGVGLDYDSLYLGLLPGWLTSGQVTSLYRDPASGVTRGGSACQTLGCNGIDEPFHGQDASGWVWAGGAEAIVVLKSPIGDLRNKLFTDPTGPFLGMGDPETWDDTITVNHGHMCGYHSCSITTWTPESDPGLNTDYEQRQFGMVASITRDVIGDRDPLNPDELGSSGISDHMIWDTWRWEEYPDRTQLDFNKWVPGGWDYDGDGVPDTLYYDDCSGQSGPQYDPVTGNAKNCAVTWSDSLPGGLGNVYGNRGAVTGVGPFSLEAGETVQWVMAVVMADDSLSLETDIARAIDHYMDFYLGPELPPSPDIVSLYVQPGGFWEDDAHIYSPAYVHLYWDDAPAAWEDPWLAKYYEELLAAPAGTELGNIRELNPWLADTIAALIPNNVEAIHIFKSCDGGTGFATGDMENECKDAPATGPGSIFTQLGWLPWATIQPDADGNFPVNDIRDEDVVGGRAYLYSMLAESRGLTVPVDTGQVLDTIAGGIVVCIDGCGWMELEVTPKLMRAISTSTSDPNVVSVYVPVSYQSGSARGTATLTRESPDCVPFARMNVELTADEAPAGDYQLRFADTVVVTELAELTAVGPEVRRTTVAAIDAGGDTETFRAPGVVALPDRPFDETVVGSTRTRVWTFDVPATAVLLDGDDVPITVTDQVHGAPTVPAPYYGLANFPHFIFTIDNTLGGGFEDQYFLDTDGDTIGRLIEPAVLYLTTLASGVSAEGRYRVNWLAPAFGDASLFELDFRDPDRTRQTVVESLEGRESSTSSTDPEIAALLGVPPESLLAVNLPFTIENITASHRMRVDPTLVHVVITRENKQTNLLLGSGLDTLWVPIPETEWIPGDELTLVEGESPDFRTTFETAVLGCDANVWLRTSCNPLTLSSPGWSGYVETEVGQQLRFSYYQTITSATEYEFQVTGAVTGQDLMATSAEAIRAALDSVNVVPNPFIVFSMYSNEEGEDRIIFTHMPPNGVLRIYTPTGQFVQLIRWGPNDLHGQGDLWFNLRTREGNEMAAGLYLFVLTAKDEVGNEIGRTRGKFVIIR
jgi:hypothetical protein